jgi:RNA ligase (TIGR02306 family)
MSFWKVTKEQIDALHPIDGADKIEAAQIKGWWCVVKKGEFQVGDAGIYIPIDSILPAIEPFDFMKQYKYRVKTIRLRKQISQGLFLPLSTFNPETLEKINNAEISVDDLSTLLDITHYDPEIDKEKNGFNSGKRKYTFPLYVRKTDEERIQNEKKYLSYFIENTFEATEKLDGTSCTIGINDNKVFVCSRNYTIEEDLNNENDSLYWGVARKYDLKNKLIQLNRNIAIQGEIIGAGICKNKYKLIDNDFYVFKIWDINNQRYLKPEETREIVKHFGLKYVPIIDNFIGICYNSKITVDKLLEYAEGKSQINPEIEREGIVFKSNEYIRGEIISFKVISNKFLLKYND